MKHTSSSCPACGGKVVPVIYGYPAPALVEDALQGEAIIGGCAVSLDGSQHAFECANCGRPST